MKSVFALFVSCCLSLPAWSGYGAPEPPPDVNARASLLFDLSSGQVLAEQNADLKLEPASLTKLMVAYVVFDAIKDGKLDLDDTYKISENASRAQGSRMFAKPGQAVSVDDLLSALLIQSANDAALALAEGLSGSEADFVSQMNEQAGKLGLASTHFTNASGLPDPQHYSTARDMTRLAGVLITRFPDMYKRYFARKQFAFNGFTQQNRNRLLWVDPVVDGVKTGHAPGAGYCTVVSASRNGRRLVATVLGARSDEARSMYAQQLLNYGFLETESIRYYRAGKPVATFPIYKGTSGNIGLGFLKDFSLTFKKGVSKNVRAEVITRQPFVAPVSKGQVMGTLRMSVDDKVVGEYPLVALDDVSVSGWLGRFWDGLRLLWK